MRAASRPRVRCRPGARWFLLLLPLTAMRQSCGVIVLAQLRVQGKTVVLRRAAAADVPAIVGLLADDQLGVTRDGVTTDEDLQPYLRAFNAIDADPAHLLLVAADGAQVLATMQLSFLPARRASGPDRGGTRQTRPTRSRAGSGAIRVGDPGGAPPPVRPGPADHGQVTSRRTPLLRASRVRRLARGAQAAVAPLTERLRNDGPLVLRPTECR
jgi:hypothetical protein